MEYLSNLHTHTLYCDGNNTAEDYIKKALELNFISIGFSGHSFIAGDEGTGWCMNELNTQKYLREISELKEKYKDSIEIYLGLETDYYSNYKSDIKEKFALDYTIGSVHLIKNPFDMKYYSIDNTPEITEKGIEAFGNIKSYIEKYYHTLTDMVVEQKPDIVGHIDLVKKFNSDNKFFNEEEKWYKDILYDVIKEIKKINSIIEINTGAISRGWNKFPYPSEFILGLIFEENIPLILNSDAHSIQNLNCFFKESLDIIKKIGFRKIKILKNNKFQDIEII